MKTRKPSIVENVGIFLANAVGFPIKKDHDITVNEYSGIGKDRRIVRGEDNKPVKKIVATVDIADVDKVTFSQSVEFFSAAHDLIVTEDAEALIESLESSTQEDDVSLFGAIAKSIARHLTDNCCTQIRQDATRTTSSENAMKKEFPQLVAEGNLPAVQRIVKGLEFLAEDMPSMKAGLAAKQDDLAMLIDTVGENFEQDANGMYLDSEDAEPDDA